MDSIGEQRTKIQNIPAYRRNSGFSLFELVVFIISVAIIYAYAANRFADFPRQAERASFIAVVTQLQTGINLELINAIGRGRTDAASQLEGINPMDLMLVAPSNYLGSFSAPGAAAIAGLQRRSWYFDSSSEELVYLINDAGGVFINQNGSSIPVNELRFRVVVDYGEVDTVSGLDVNIAGKTDEIPAENRRRRLNGVILRPVVPFEWRGVAEDELLSETLAENSA